jgi:hypothetical protein
VRSGPRNGSKSRWPLATTRACCVATMLTSGPASAHPAARTCTPPPAWTGWEPGTRHLGAQPKPSPPPTRQPAGMARRVRLHTEPRAASAAAIPNPLTHAPARTGVVHQVQQQARALPPVAHGVELLEGLDAALKHACSQPASHTARRVMAEPRSHVLALVPSQVQAQAQGLAEVSVDDLAVRAHVQVAAGFQLPHSRHRPAATSCFWRLLQGRL